MQRDFSNGSILKLLIQFTIPLLIGDVFQQLYNLADSIIVGRYIGKAALAAVGSTTPLINTVIGLFLGISVGASVIISQRFGAKDNDGLSKAIHSAVAVAIVLSFCFTIVGTVFSPMLLRMVSTPTDVFGTALTYLRIYFLGISGLIVFNICTGILRAIGEIRQPIYALIFSTLFNVILDLVFVIWFQMGIAGAAFATIATQFWSAMYLVFVLCRGSGSSKLCFQRIRIHTQIAIEILRVGIPIGLQRTITAFSNTIVQSYINAFGSDYMAGWAVYNKVHQFAVMPMNNIGTATVTFVGQNYGAKNEVRVKAGVKAAVWLNLLVTTAISGVLFCFAPQFSLVFSTESNVVKTGVMFLRLLAMMIPIATINITFAGAIRGMGDGKGPMIIMLIGHVLMRQVYLALVVGTNHTVQSIAISYPFGWAVSSLIMLIYYRMIIAKKGQKLDALE